MKTCLVWENGGGLSGKVGTGEFWKMFCQDSHSTRDGRLSASGDVLQGFRESVSRTGSRSKPFHVNLQYDSKQNGLKVSFRCEMESDTGAMKWLLTNVTKETGMAEKTIFKKIIDREVPVELLYEDEQCVAFQDINPQAPVHILVIPRKEIPSLQEIEPADETLLGHLLVVCRKLAEEHGLSKGYRTVINAGPDGGQTVDHLHIHLLGKRPMKWPPG